MCAINYNCLRKDKKGEKSATSTKFVQIKSTLCRIHTVHAAWQFNGGTICGAIQIVSLSAHQSVTNPVAPIVQLLRRANPNRTGEWKSAAKCGQWLDFKYSELLWLRWVSHTVHMSCCCVVKSYYSSSTARRLSS